MKIIKILPILLVFPGVLFAANRSDSTARIGVSRGSQAASRMPTLSIVNVDTKAIVNSVQNNKAEDATKNVAGGAVSVAPTLKASVSSASGGAVVVSGDCRDAYRACMDQFCLLDESQGERCACSDNINAAKSKINAILAIQAEADSLYTEGIEREKLGAKARLVFADNTSNTQVSSADFMSWLTGGEEDEDDEEEVGEDLTLGEDLYKMAAKYCQAELDSCGDKAEMESMLYTRLIAQDCKSYDAYLTDQKSNAESNKRIAESAVRNERLKMLDTTNKYNRGECLLAYRSCIADKGGCGANFENCLDAKLLNRRANACENVLDQCMAVRDYVVQDWTAESKSILAEAEKYADKNRRATCLAKVQNCLEEGCSTTTNSECLTDVNVAAGVCPIITECDEMIPGFQAVVNDKLGYLQTKFCENDIDKCLQDKCGTDFTKPECIGKKPYEIAALCPQDMFPSCKNATQYDIIVQSAILQMDYQMYVGCVNYFGEQLGKVCGTDMSCLPIDSTVVSLANLPETETDAANLRKTVVANSDAAVEEFFKQFEQDKTVAACADSQSVDASKKVKGKDSLGVSVFNTAKLLAKMSAENRNLRELDSKISELARQAGLETARNVCLNTYKPEKPNDSKSNYSYIRSVSFEPDLRNCHVCRMQQVCEQGGESKKTAALKAAGAGLSAGMSAGSLAGGWGALIGSVGGAAAAGLGGYLLSDDKQEFCQEIESCEDINMSPFSDPVKISNK